VALECCLGSQSSDAVATEINNLVRRFLCTTSVLMHLGKPSLPNSSLQFSKALEDISGLARLCFHYSHFSEYSHLLSTNLVTASAESRTLTFHDSRGILIGPLVQSVDELRVAVESERISLSTPESKTRLFDIGALAEREHEWFHQLQTLLARNQVLLHSADSQEPRSAGANSNYDRIAEYYETDWLKRYYSRSDTMSRRYAIGSRSSATLTRKGCRRCPTSRRSVQLSGATFAQCGTF
jgi:hypothetical protein